jgi:predicted transcriptional regulator
MPTLDKNALLELEILNHVESSPKLNNRMAAAKLGCSVKLAHALLSKMVDRGLLHVKKLHSRRWDYFLTPTGISEKARLTYEFLDFSFHFYQDARKASSTVCRNLAEAGVGTVSFLGTGDLAEIVYLGVKEWNLTLHEVFDDDSADFLGHKVLPISQLSASKADAILVCLYDKSAPMSRNYLPAGLEHMDNMRWVFGESPSLAFGSAVEKKPASVSVTH